MRPVGFRISEKAFNKHKILHKTAVANGAPLADVLAEFMADVQEHAAEEPGRLVCHHIEFIAGGLFLQR